MDTASTDSQRPKDKATGSAKDRAAGAARATGQRLVASAHRGAVAARGGLQRFAPVLAGWMKAAGRRLAWLLRGEGRLGARISAVARHVSDGARSLGRVLATRLEWLAPLGRRLADQAGRGARAVRAEAGKEKYRQYLSDAYRDLRKRYPAVESTAKEVLDAVGVRKKKTKKRSTTGARAGTTRKKKTTARKKATTTTTTTARKKSPARKATRKKAA